MWKLPYDKEPTNQTKFFVVMTVMVFGHQETWFYYHNTWESAYAQVTSKTRGAGEGNQTISLHRYNRNWRIDHEIEPVLYQIVLTVDPIKRVWPIEPNDLINAGI